MSDRVDEVLLVVAVERKSFNGQRFPFRFSRRKILHRDHPLRAANLSKASVSSHLHTNAIWRCLQLAFEVRCGGHPLVLHTLLKIKHRTRKHTNVTESGGLSEVFSGCAETVVTTLGSQIAPSQTAHTQSWPHVSPKEGHC